MQSVNAAVSSVVNSHDFRCWSDDEDDLDAHASPALAAATSSSSSKIIGSSAAAASSSSSSPDTYLFSAVIAPGGASSSTAQQQQQPQQQQKPETATPVRLLCEVVPLEIISAAPRALHEHSHRVRALLKILRSASRVVSSALDELRRSIAAHNEADDDDDEEEDGAEGSHHHRAVPSSFDGASWEAAVKLGGFVPPVAWLRTSCIVPSVSIANPPPLRLPGHCFLDVQCAVDAKCESASASAAAATDGGCSARRDVAPLVALLCFVVAKLLSNTAASSAKCQHDHQLDPEALLGALVASCFANIVVAKRKDASALSSSELLFVRPRLLDLMEATQEQPSSRSDDNDDDKLFERCLSSISKCMGDSKNQQQQQQQSLSNFVTSALVALFSRSSRHNSRRSLAEKEAVIGAFGINFHVSDARTALRAFTVPIERDIMAASTNNTAQQDLLETYVAAHMVRRSAQCRSALHSHDGDAARMLVDFVDSLFVVDDEDVEQASTTVAAPPLVSRRLTVDMLVLESVLGKQRNTQHQQQQPQRPVEVQVSSVALAQLREDQAVHKSIVGILNSGSSASSCSAERLRVELQEGRKLVPPSLRLAVWAVLLGVPSSSSSSSSNTATFAADIANAAFQAGPCDRQVTLDLPRCHPTDPFTRSPAGQVAIHRLVRMWLHITRKELAAKQQQTSTTSETGTVSHSRTISNASTAQQQTQQPVSAIHYWQGIDSMCAAVLTAGKDEVLAAHCLSRLVHLLIPGFAASGAIRARVGRLAGLLRFHDPFAAAHLDEACGVQIDHFALPWILTAFVHVFPLSLTCRLWDALVLHRDPVSLLCNFTVAVITAVRLKFLNAPDLASSLLVLRHAAASVCGVASAGGEEESAAALDSFDKALQRARDMARVSPPYCRDAWDDPASENAIEQLVAPPRVFAASHNDDDDDDDAAAMAIPLKRYIASVALSDISISDDGRAPARWSNVILVLVVEHSAEQQQQNELEQKLLFVVGQRYALDISSGADTADATMNEIRKLTKHKSVARGGGAAGGDFIVAVAALEKMQALEAAVLLTSEGVEHVATVDF